MPSTHSQGVFSRVLFETGESPHVFDDESLALEYHRHDIRKHGRIIGGNGIRGTRSRFKVRHREGAYFVYGTMVMYVDPGVLASLLPLMIGDNVNATTFSLAEDLPYFGILAHNDQAQLTEFQDCKVDSWSIRSQAVQFQEEGEPDMLELSLTVVGTDTVDDTEWPDPAPEINTEANAAPYAFQDCTVTLNAGLRAMEEFVLTGDNFLYPKYVNGLIPHSISPRDRLYRLVCRVPWNEDHDDLYDMAPAGAAASLAFTNGDLSTTFNFANLHIPAHGPAPDRGKQQIGLLLAGTASATGTTNSTRELQIINDSEA